MEKQFHKLKNMLVLCRIVSHLIIIFLLVSNSAHSEIVGNKMLSKFSQKNSSATKKYKPVEEMYEIATKEIENLEFQKASETLKEIQEIYPFSTQANKAVLLSSYSNYMIAEYELAFIDVERFISTNPYYQHRDYALYLRSMILYKKLLGANSDAQTAKKAQLYIEELIAEYPKTKYAISMSFKLNFVKHIIALKEIQIGRFYSRNGNCIATLTRLDYFLKNNQETFYTPEALYRMFSCYKILGIEKEADHFYNLISSNYPFSIWRDEIINNYPQYESRTNQE